MKLPCYLVQDLLPLYKDHVCDEQTSADVAEHLSDCAACSALLAEMDAQQVLGSRGAQVCVPGCVSDQTLEVGGAEIDPRAHT